MSTLGANGAPTPKGARPSSFPATYGRAAGGADGVVPRRARTPLRHSARPSGGTPYASNARRARKDSRRGRGLVERLHAVSAPVLGGIEGGVGRLQEPSRRGGVFGEGRHADADRDPRAVGARAGDHGGRDRGSKLLG